MNQMSTKERSNIAPVEVYKDEFISLHRFEGKDIVMCVADTEYIPIEHFKKSFMAIGELIKKNNWKALIFDKRNLNTFHQPSMEWYYTEWKADMINHGLSSHYKILPSMPWFAKSVEAGKRDIKRNHPSFDFDEFSVKYVDSVEEAIKDFDQTN
tara:strand:+ start:23832 stop:24293 length:462 start_codon:yes stop_codon:yes gene_type:complete